MSKIFVRDRRHAGEGTGRPRYAIVAVEGADLKVYAPHVRKVELEKLAEAIGAEIVYLPRGEKAGERRESESGQRGWGRRHSRQE